MRNLLNLFALPVFLFCGFLKMNSLGNDYKIRDESLLKRSGQIIYLFFRVEKTPSAVEKITLEEKKITEGKLKSMPVFDKSSGNTGDFIVSLNDIDGKEIIRQIVEDPLNPELESFTEEGISRNKVSLQNAEFSIRYSHIEEVTSVKIEKITNSGKQLLFSQKL